MTFQSYCAGVAAITSWFRTRSVAANIKFAVGDLHSLQCRRKPRGVRESGELFATQTYAFILLPVMIGYGICTTLTKAGISFPGMRIEMQTYKINP